MVTSNYLQALWERTSPASPLPHPTDCEPERDGQTFWYTPADSQLFLGATFLSSKADDVELLVRAAGAVVAPLHELKIAQALVKVDAFLHSDEQESAQNYSCFALSDDKSRRKLPKLLKERGVPQVSGKTIAKCITEQKPLHDGKGNRIGTPPTSKIQNTSADTENSQKAAKETQEPEPAPEEPVAAAAAKIDDDFPVPDDIEEPFEDPQSQSRVMEVEVADGANNASLENPAKKDTPSRDDTQEVERAEDMDLDTSGPASKTKEASTGGADAGGGTRPSKRKHNVREEAAEEEKEPDSLPAHKRARNMQKDKGGDDDDHGRPGERKKLKSNGNGWSVAAPKGKRRRAYISSKEEMMEATGCDDLSGVAPTETEKGMVLAPMQQPNRFTSRSSGRADFKRFRKNPVVRAPARSRIQLRAVLPRVPEKLQGQFDEQQRALEEQQQKADELFGEARDARRKTASSRRRSDS
jgi:hypothetical protein